MTQEQLREFLEEQNKAPTDSRLTNKRAAETDVKVAKINKDRTEHAGGDSISSSFEITIYKRAVRTLDPNLEAKIDELLNKSRGETMGLTKNSFSLDDYMDTSDKLIDVAPHLT